MATTTASTNSLPLSSPPPSRRLSKILSGGSGVRRGSEAQSETGSAGTGTGIRSSLDSLRDGLHQRLDKSPTLSAARSPSRDGSSHGAGVRKLLPGHAKRERKRIRDEELKAAAEEAARGRQPNTDDHSSSHPPLEHHSERAPFTRSASSLITNDSDLESPPPLVTRDSHTGYLTTTSPLIKTTTTHTDSADPNIAAAMESNGNLSLEQFPAIVEPPQHSIASTSPSPKSSLPYATSPVPSLTNLNDKNAASLRPQPVDTQKRGKSPARKFKDVFARGNKSAKSSPERPERAESEPPVVDGSLLRKTSTGFGESRLAQNPEKRGPSPLRSQTIPTISPDEGPRTAMPILQTDVPKTPPHTILQAPETTVTPPTPTDGANRRSFQSTARLSQDSEPATKERSDSAPSDILSHRRIRSASSLGHQKSKLSTSMMPPLTPTIEEVKAATPAAGSPGLRNISSGGAGFFSSWVSAAQNAASTITGLTNQNNRSRSGTGASDPSKPKLNGESLRNDSSNEQPEDVNESPKRQMAVETMGTGDLNLSHLGIDSNATEPSLLKSQGPLGDPLVKREDTAARIEDMLAKRAVSQAYERPGKSGEATPVAELPDPLASAKPSSLYDGSQNPAGLSTPPGGSIFEGDPGTGGVRRSNSVRSKLHNRRSRGSSVTTGQSVMSAMIGASTATLTNPAAGPRLSGFAIAPKQRNRAFHQLFRSVPEDDYLIEDYSCALQKDILLAGRIYISEGHICFSSNILGWVTTLIISFEEVVSVEKENTAIVIPNAIAVQTLHARHTFRSLLSREATYDLMIGIWRVSHPDSFQKSVNGKQLASTEMKAEEANNEANVGSNEASDDDSDEDSGSDDDDASQPSMGSSGSIAGSEFLDAKTLSRKPSGIKEVTATAIAAPAGAPTGEAVLAVAPVVAGAPDGAADFPGPSTHAPTDCTDKATHYDKIIKDDIIPAPLGKVYSLLYGPQSGAFCRKLLEQGISKAQDLQLEDDKKGLNHENKTRQYKYIKPLFGAIGPKQTTTITTENLDVFDLEKAVSVTCTTQTPDVPSGSAFSVKTRYCLSWAPNNQTRFQMNMTIEWTAKSWIKGPIEKGALDGQTQYGDDLVKTLKAALGRTRAATTGSKTAKGKKKRKGSKKDKDEKAQEEAQKKEDWGLFEPVRPILGPVVAPLQPFFKMHIIVSVLAFMVLWMWFRGGAGSRSSALSAAGRAERFAYYEDLWQKEEVDLWDWLESRVGVDTVVIQGQTKDTRGESSVIDRTKQRQKLLKSKDLTAKLREEKKNKKELEAALRIAQERLDTVKQKLDNAK